MASTDYSGGFKAVNRKSLVAVLSHACNDVRRELERVPLEHWDESVFRFFVVQRLLKEMPKVRCETEWHRIDLVLFEPRGATLIELKFFRAMPLVDYEENEVRMKGGPSKRNYEEYKGAIKKLQTIRRRKWIGDCGHVAGAYLLLAYSDRAVPPIPKLTFGSFYDAIGKSTYGQAKTILKRTRVCGKFHLTCKLIPLLA